MISGGAPFGFCPSFCLSLRLLLSAAFERCDVDATQRSPSRKVCCFRTEESNGRTLTLSLSFPLCSVCLSVSSSSLAEVDTTR